MKLKSVQIKDFRRFTDLTVKNIPQDAKLIILVGPNGCGKSAFFDALNIFYLKHKRVGYSWDKDYHPKSNTQLDMHDDRIKIQFYDHEVTSEITENDKKAFYIRSAYRNESEFQRQHLEQTQKKLEEYRTQRMIDNESFVSRNYQRLVSNGFEVIFDPKNKGWSIGDFTNQLIGEVRDSFSKLFFETIFCDLGNPLTDGTFRFSKGIIKKFCI